MMKQSGSANKPPTWRLRARVAVPSDLKRQLNISSVQFCIMPRVGSVGIYLKSTSTPCLRGTTPENQRAERLEKYSRVLSSLTITPSPFSQPSPAVYHFMVSLSKTSPWIFEKHKLIYMFPKGSWGCFWKRHHDQCGIQQDSASWKEEKGGLLEHSWVSFWALLPGEGDSWTRNMVNENPWAITLFNFPILCQSLLSSENFLLPEWIYKSHTGALLANRQYGWLIWTPCWGLSSTALPQWRSKRNKKADCYSRPSHPELGLPTHSSCHSCLSVWGSESQINNIHMYMFNLWPQKNKNNL